MGERITFRGRGRGLVVSDGGTPMPAVSIAEPRVKFIKGWLTGGTDPGDGSVECGDGTAYPLEVTVDQLAGMFYRVKDGWFTAGSLSKITGIPDPGSSSTTTIAGTPPAEKFSYFETSYIDSGYSRRGYSLEADPFSNLIDLPDLEYYSAPYAVGDSSLNAYDMDNEYGMWSSFGGSTAGHGSLFYYNSEPLFPLYNRSAFEHAILTDTDDGEDIEGNYGLQPTNTNGGYETLSLIFSGKVTWVGGDNPFDPAATLYVGLEFDVSGSGGDASSNKTGKSDAYAVLKLELTGVDFVSCPLYTLNSDTVTDFVITAQEWWPYATKSGLPAYDSATGLPINGGPGA
jgi:hypothetical protein